MATPDRSRLVKALYSSQRRAVTVLTPLALTRLAPVTSRKVSSMSRVEPAAVHLGHQAIEDVGMAAEESEQPRLVGRCLADLGDPQRDLAFGRPQPPGLVTVSVPAMRRGAAMADVAVPAEEIGGFLLEQLLRQPLGPQAKHRPHHVLVLWHAVPEQTRDLFPNLGARCYPGHGSGLPFLLRKELVFGDTIRVTQAFNVYRDSTTSPGCRALRKEVGDLLAPPSLSAEP